VKDKAVDCELETEFYCEDGGEKVVEFVEELVSRGVVVEGVFRAEEGGGDENAAEDYVAKYTICYDFVKKFANPDKRKWKKIC